MQDKRTGKLLYSLPVDYGYGSTGRTQELHAARSGYLGNLSQKKGERVQEILNLAHSGRQAAATDPEKAALALVMGLSGLAAKLELLPDAAREEYLLALAGALNPETAGEVWRKIGQNQSRKTN
jgi:hypothetical protein